MLNVDFILGFFHLMINALQRREQKLLAKAEAKSAKIGRLIHQRESHVAEQFRASAAIKKLKEFGI